MHTRVPLLSPNNHSIGGDPFSTFVDNWTIDADS